MRHRSALVLLAAIGGLVAVALVFVLPGTTHHHATVTAPTVIVGWGNVENGEAGIGYFAAKGDQIPEGVTLPAGVQEISVGSGSTAALAGGSVYTWGDNYAYNLGSGANRENFAKPAKVAGLSGITRVAMGGQHGAAINAAGHAWVWGAAMYGDFCNGETGEGVEAKAKHQPLPVEVPQLQEISAIYAGAADLFAVNKAGTVFFCGEGSVAGNGTTLESAVPQEVPGVVSPKEIAVNGVSTKGSHALALMPDGTVKAWGANQYGQLGLGRIDHYPVSTPTTVPGLSNIKQVAVSEFDSYALTNEGLVYGWGLSSEDQVPNPGAEVHECGFALKPPPPCIWSPVILSLNPVKQVAAGKNSVYLLFNDGEVQSEGANDNAQLGSGLTESPVAHPVRTNVSAVSKIVAGGSFAFAFTTTPPPAPVIESSAGVGSVSATWRWPAEAEPWKVAIRLAAPGSPLGPYTELPATARTLSFTELSAGVPLVAGTVYRIQVRNNTFGERSVVATAK